MKIVNVSWSGSLINDNFVCIYISEVNPGEFLLVQPFMAKNLEAKNTIKNTNTVSIPPQNNNIILNGNDSRFHDLWSLYTILFMKQLVWHTLTHTHTFTITVQQNYGNILLTFSGFPTWHNAIQTVDDSNTNRSGKNLDRRSLGMNADGNNSSGQRSKYLVQIRPGFSVTYKSHWATHSNTRTF